MDEFFNNWFNTTDEQKEVYASAAGLTMFELKYLFQQWYFCKLIDDGHAFPASVYCDAFSNVSNNETTANKAIITFRQMKAVFDWMPNGGRLTRQEQEELELELHAYDFDTPYVKRILDEFDRLRSSAAWGNQQKQLSTFEILQQYFSTQQTINGNALFL